MRRGIILLAVFILALSMVSAGDVILKLSSSSNAHGELANQTNYNTLINYSAIFGSVYTGASPETCTGTNTVLKLSSLTNAHAEAPTGTNYNVNVCYGDLICTYRPKVGDTTAQCNADEVCVVTLSDSTNAHFAKCNLIPLPEGGGGSYQNKICCKPGNGTGVVNCSDYHTNATCLAASPNCTWTPPGTTNNTNGGGCCPLDSKWNPYTSECGETDVLPCTIIWTISTQSQGSQGSYRFATPTQCQYCAKVTSGLNYGYWYNVDTF